MLIKLLRKCICKILHLCFAELRFNTECDIIKKDRDSALIKNREMFDMVNIYFFTIIDVL